MQNYTKQHQVVIETVEHLVNAYQDNDVKKQQKYYDYLRGYCDGLNANFNNALDGALDILQKECLGIEDTKKYKKFIQGM